MHANALNNDRINEWNVLKKNWILNHLYGMKQTVNQTIDDIK